MSELARLRARLDEMNTGDRSDVADALLPDLLAVVEASATMRDMLRVCGTPGWAVSREATLTAWDAWSESHAALDARIREVLGDEGGEA